MTHTYLFRVIVLESFATAVSRMSRTPLRRALLRIYYNDRTDYADLI